MLVAALVIAGGVFLAAAPAGAATIAAGTFHTCSIQDDAGVVCWGDNEVGQLGDDTRTSRSAPVRVEGLTNATAVTAGDRHSCALLTDGTVRCWGSNFSGQLGDGSTTRSSVPVTVENLDDAVAISAGHNTNCALRATGTVRCWGLNGDGQIGDGSTTNALQATNVIGLGGATGVSTGYRSSCALLTNGRVTCWGRNANGQLGDDTNVDQHQPSTEVIGLTDGVAIDVGGSTGHACAVRSTGKVACWGYNSAGQLGNDSVVSSRTPVEVLGLSDAVAVSLGTSSSPCALTTSGQAYCWGDNTLGELGTGSTAASSLVAVAVPDATNGTEIAHGWAHSCLKSAAKTVRCWGYGHRGQLGNGRSEIADAAQAVPGVSGAAAVGVGGGFSCALRTVGTVSCWGSNSSGQLGNGTTATTVAPVDVTGVTDANALSVGARHACAIRGSARRQLSCWGNNSWLAPGALGDGTLIDRSSPVDVDTSGFAPANPEGRFLAVSAGYSHTCALWHRQPANADAQVWCWGQGTEGALGDGALLDRTTPRQAAGGWGFKPSQADGPTLAAGFRHTCAITRVSTVVCWGNNQGDQLGDPSRPSPSNVPQLVRTAPGVSLTDARALTVGERHTCALRAGGDVWCWGRNIEAQVTHPGSNPGVHPYPVQIATPGIAGIRAVAAGETQSCVEAAAVLTCWGKDFGGTVVATPTPVSGLTVGAPPAAPAAPGPVVALSDSHGCAVTPQTSVACWGSSADGGLGNGSMPTGNHPQQRTPTWVVGLGPVSDPGPPPVVLPVPGPAPNPAPILTPGDEPHPAPVPAVGPRRPRAPTVEFRDGKLALRALALRRTKTARTCPRTARATITARVGRRTVRTAKNVRLRAVGTGCHATATIGLRGALGAAPKVTVVLTAKGLVRSQRTAKARTTVALRAGRLRLDQLPLRGTRRDVCPTRASVTVVGATAATKRARFTKQRLIVRFAPNAHCQVTANLRLPVSLRRATKVTVTVTGSGLARTRRTVRSR